MNNPQPEPKGTAIVKRINVLAEQKSRKEDISFPLARVEKEIQNLIHDDAAAAYDLLGMVASLRGDEDSVRKYHENALRLDPGDREVLCNYATSLGRLGFHSEARQKLIDAYKLHVGAPEILREIVKYSITSGRFHEAAEWYEQLRKELPEIEHAEQGILSVGLPLLESKGITDNEVENATRLATQVFQKFGAVFDQINVSVNEDDESAWLSFVFSMDMPVEDVVKLNIAYADRLAEAPVMPSVSVRFTSAS